MKSVAAYLLILATSLHGQTTTKDVQIEIDSLIQAMVKENMVTGNAVGYAGEEPEQWRRYDRLRFISSSATLINLTDHSSPVIRCYSYQALVDRKSDDLFPILLNHILDTSSVTTYFGCIMDEEKVGDYFLDASTQESGASNNILTLKQRSHIDSILLFDPRIRLEAKLHLLRQLSVSPIYYGRVREIAMQEHLPVATLALARYQNQGDIPFIKKCLRNKDSQYFGIYGVREFPDTAFYSSLLNIFEQEWKNKYYDFPKWRILYQALAKYPTSRTLALFERTLATKNKSRYQYLCSYLSIALIKYPNRLFAPLLKKIILNDFYLKKAESEKNIEL
jgi:hypothetical protein